MISSIIQVLFKIKIQPNISDQEKKRQWIYDLLNAESKLKFLCLQRKNIFFTRVEDCRKNEKKAY